MVLMRWYATFAILVLALLRLGLYYHFEYYVAIGAVLLFLWGLWLVRYSKHQLKMRRGLSFNILDNLGVGTVVFDEHVRVVYANPSSITLEHNRFGDKGWSAELHNHVEKIARQSLKSNTIVEEIIYLEKVNQYFDVKATPLQCFLNSNMGVLVLIRDVTAKILFGKHSRQSEKLTLVADLAVGTACQIRNPLTAIKGFSQLLLQRYEEKALTRETNYLHIVLQEVQRVEHLVHQLMCFAEPTDLDKQKLNLCQVIDQTVEILEQEAIRQGHVVSFTTNMEQMYIVGSGNQLKQVFLNLGFNALAAMESQGQLDIVCQGDERFIYVSFKDTGVGMNEQELASIFNPFYTTKDTGTGLGLTICQRILDNHGATVKVTSKKGEGSHFVLAFPRLRLEEREVEYDRRTA